ncbi:MAG TPA: hypothetical protein VKB88_30990 [Bryobacteraceae bacterium]|nr:hypothetical protein [Bryobacteraceae bacterium]
MVWATASGLVVWTGILFPPGLAIYALLKWQGKWRLAAAAPVAALAVFFVPLILDWQRDATAVNLWGLLFVPVAMLLAIYSGMVVILYRREKT